MNVQLRIIPVSLQEAYEAFERELATNTKLKEYSITMGAFRNKIGHETRNVFFVLVPTHGKPVTGSFTEDSFQKDIENLTLKIRSL